MINFYLNNNIFLLNEVLKLYANLTDKNLNKYTIKINVIKLEKISFKIIDNFEKKIIWKHIDNYSFANGYDCDLILEIKINNNYSNGIYYIELILAENKYYTIFIVNKEKTSETLLLFNTFTWCAYNRHNNEYPEKLTSAYRYDKQDTIFKSHKSLKLPYSTKLSLNRTNLDISESIKNIINTDFDNLQNLPRAKEYYHLLMPLYLNNNNISFDCITDETMDDINFINRMNKYKCIIINSHSEYWSRNAVINMNKFILNNGNVVNLSGNTMYWSVYFNRNDRFLEIRKHQFWNYNPKLKKNPFNKTLLKFTNGENGGLWYELENEIAPYLSSKLFGNNSFFPTVFTQHANLNAPLKIINKNSWIFNTIEKKLNEIGKLSLNHNKTDIIQGASGYEVDQIAYEEYSKFIVMQGKNKDKDNKNIGCDVLLIEKENGRIYSVASLSYIASLFIDKPLMKVTNHIINIFSYPYKIIGLGLSKSGTTSLNTLLEEFGFKSTHNSGDIQNKITKAILEKKNLLYYLDNFQCVTSGTHTYEKYKQIDKEYKCKFILTIRNIDMWLNSCYKHVERNRNNPRYKGNWTVYDKQKLKDQYYSHTKDIIKYFTNSDKLLIINITEKQDENNLLVNKVARFLNINNINITFPHKNKN